MKALLIIDKPIFSLDYKDYQKYYILNWNRNNKNKYKSIFNLIEKKDAFYQKKYVELINKMKNKIYFKKSLYDHFLIDKEFKLWEMSLLEEKSFYKTPEINEIIKILALKEFIKINNIKNLVLYSENKDLKINIKSLIHNLTITYNKDLKFEIFKNIIKKNYLYYFYYLINFFKRRYLLKKKIFSLKKDAILICDYFTYFNTKKALDGKYVSTFWRNLLPLLKKKKLNFLHLTLDEKKLDLKAKNTILEKLNKKDISHNILDAFINFEIFFKVLKIWIRNVVIYNRIKIKYSDDLIFHNKIFEIMVRNSLVGVWSIKNLYFFFLFEGFFKKNYDKISNIFYVSEFHGWEKSFLYNSKKYSLSNNFAVHFNAIRNWDLRYKFLITKDNYNVFPDNIINFDYPSRKYFANLFTNMKKKSLITTKNLRPLNIDLKKLKKFKKNKILIIGDHDDYSTINLLKMIDEFKNIYAGYDFEYKPHPISNIKISDFPNISKIKIHRNNYCFKNLYTAYIVSNKTSLGIELINKKMKTAILLDNDSVNLSPVSKNYKYFIQTINDLKNFLETKITYENIKSKKLTSWKNIIKRL